MSKVTDILQKVSDCWMKWYWKSRVNLDMFLCYLSSLIARCHLCSRQLHYLSRLRCHNNWLGFRWPLFDGFPNCFSLPVSVNGDISATVVIPHDILLKAFSYFIWVMFGKLYFFVIMRWFCYCDWYSYHYARKSFYPLYWSFLQA